MNYSKSQRVRRAGHGAEPSRPDIVEQRRQLEALLVEGTALRIAALSVGLCVSAARRERDLILARLLSRHHALQEREG